jgi:hypothetical protein
MSLFRCRECDHEISTEALQCPHCGAPVDVEFPEQDHPRRFRRRPVYYGGFLTTVVVLVILYVLYRKYGFGREQIDGMIHWCRNLYQSHR